MTWAFQGDTTLAPDTTTSSVPDTTIPPDTTLYTGPVGTGCPREGCATTTMPGSYPAQLVGSDGAVTDYGAYLLVAMLLLVAGVWVLVGFAVGRRGRD